MPLENILDEDLEEVLYVLRDLSFSSTSELKLEEFKIIHEYDIEYMLYRFQEYIKSLPRLDISLNVSNRLLIYNARLILEGLSMIGDTHINYITRVYSNWLKVRERRLIPDLRDRAEIKKPRSRTIKTKEFKPIPKVIEILNDELPDIRKEGHSALLGEINLPDAVDDGGLLFERHSQLLTSQLTSATGLSADLLLRFPESLGDTLAHLPPDASGADLVTSQQHLSLPPVIEQPFDVEPPVAPTVMHEPSVELLALDLERIIENIDECSVSRVKRRPKISKSVFRKRPIMTSDEYGRFLMRKRVVPDPVKFYLRKKSDSAESSEMAMVESELLDHGLDELLKFPTNKVPVPIIPLYLRKQPLILTDSGNIPEFELITGEQKDITSKRSKALEGSKIDEYEGQLVSETRFSPSRDSRPRILPVSYQDEIEDIESHLSLLMNALSLHEIQRTSMPFPSEAGPLHMDTRGRAMLSPLKHVDESALMIQTTGVQSRLETLDELFIKITQECSEHQIQVIRFTDICNLSETKLIAARVFGQIIELWAKKLVTLHQTSSHPQDIFITMNQ